MKSKPLNQLFSISSEFTRHVIFALLEGDWGALYSFSDQAGKTIKDSFEDGGGPIKQAWILFEQHNHSINIRVKRRYTILKILLPRDNYNKAFYTYRDLREDD